MGAGTTADGNEVIPLRISIPIPAASNPIGVGFGRNSETQTTKPDALNCNQAKPAVQIVELNRPSLAIGLAGVDRPSMDSPQK